MREKIVCYFWMFREVVDDDDDDDHNNKRKKSSGDKQHIILLNFFVYNLKGCWSTLRDNNYSIYALVQN